MPNSSATRKRLKETALTDALLKWYDKHQRDLPWRRTDDPYRIWLSEVMLQQTQVETVLPYYGRFLQAFPDMSSLARASLDRVLKMWEGLGYYARARNLHRAAAAVCEVGGELPDSYDALQRVPGIGPYTAAAVASIAFGEVKAVLDGNVMRVLVRLHNIQQSPKEKETKKELQRLADALISRQRPGDFNQAMMELGATICTPRRPQCKSCPVRDHCLAHMRLPDPSALPVKSAKPPKPHHDVVAGVVRHGGKVLIRRRPERGLLGGLWEFPGRQLTEGEELSDVLRDELQRSAALQVDVGTSLLTVKHAYTHFRITLHALECRRLNGKGIGRSSELRWVNLTELRDFAFSKSHLKIIDHLLMSTKNDD